MKKFLYQFILIAATWLTAQTHTKELRITNHTDKAVTLSLSHFYTITGIDRSPTISTVTLKKKGDYEDISIKPYSYASDIYIPNQAWVNATSDDYEQQVRTAQIKKDYSFGIPNENEYYSALINIDGQLYLAIEAFPDSNHIGQQIQAMPDNPDDLYTPNNGLYIYINEKNEPQIRTAYGTSTWDWPARKVDRISSTTSSIDTEGGEQYEAIANN